MLADLLTAAVRSLAVTVVLGSILIYATGGLYSPHAPAMVGVVAVCFFLFWVTFFFMFGPRVPKRRGGREESELDNAALLAPRRHRRREDEESESETTDGGFGTGSD